MKFSDNTMSVLRNFSDINQNILVKEGNILKTISEARNVLSTAELDDSFPKYLLKNIDKFKNFIEN